MSDPYVGIPSLNAAYEKDPAFGKAVVERYRKLMASGANKARIQREAEIIGYAPIVDMGDGQRQDMTDFLSQQAPRTFAEGVQDITMGVGRGVLSFAPDALDLGGLALRQVGYEGLSQYAQEVRDGINEFLPMSNEYRAARRSRDIFDLNPSAISQGLGSIGSMYAGGGLIKGAAKFTSLATGGRLGAATAKAPLLAGGAKGVTSPAIKAGIVMGAGSAAGQARQEGATPGESILPALGGAAGGYLEKFGTERLVSKVFGGKATDLIRKDATGKFIFPKASQMPGFLGTAGTSLGAEIGEEQVANLALELGRTSYAKEPLGERVVQGQIETLATAPYSIGPLSVYAGVRASALKGRVGAAERMFTERGKSIFNLDGVGDKPIGRSYVDPKVISAEDQAALDSMNAVSGGNLVVSSASHEGLNDMARRVADSGIRVVFVGQAPTAAEAGAEAKPKPGVGGFFDHKNNTIYINSDLPPEQQVIFGLMHETIHRLAKSEPTGTQGLFDRVSSVFGKQFTDYAEALQKRYESAGVMDPAMLTEEGFANFLTQALYGYTAAALTDENEMRMLALADYGMFTDIANVFGGWASTLVGKPVSAKYDSQLANRLAAAVQNLNQSAGVSGEQGIEVSGETAARDFSFAREFIESMQKMLGDSGTQMESIRRATADVLSERDAMSESFMLSELADRLGVSIPEAKNLYEQATANIPLSAAQIDVKNQAVVDAAKLEETKAAEAAAAEAKTAEEAAAAEAKAKADQEEAERQTQREEVVNALVLANKLASKLGVDPVDLLDKNIRSMTTVDDETLNLLGKNKVITDAELAGLQAARAAWARAGDAVRTGDELARQRARSEELQAFDRTELERRARRSRRTPAEVMEEAAEEARKSEAEKKRVADEAAAAKKKAEEERLAAKKKKEEDAAAEKQRKEADREAAKKTAEGKRAITKARGVYDGVMRDYATAKRRVEAATKANNTKQLPKLQTEANELALKAKEAADAYEALAGEKLPVPEVAAAPAPAAPTAPAAGTTAPPAPAATGAVTAQQLEDLANPSKTTDEQLDAAIKANKQLSDALEGVEPSMRRNILYAHAQQMKNGGAFSILFNATVETEKLEDIKKLAVGDKLGILAANKVVAGIVRRFLPQTKTNYGYGIFDGGVERSMAMDVDTEDVDEARRAMLGIFGPFGFRQYAVFEIDTSWRQDERNPVPIGQPIPGKEGYYAQQMHEIRGRITLPAQDIANEAKKLGVIGLTVLHNRAFGYTTSYNETQQDRNDLAANWQKLYRWINDEQGKLGKGTRLQVASRPIALRENSAASAANERQSPYETNSISRWWTANKGTVEAGLTGKQLSKLDLAKEPTGPFSLLFQPGEKRSTYKPQTTGAKQFGAIQSVINAAFDGPEPQFITNPTKASNLAGGRVRTIAQYFRSLMNDKDVIDYRKAYPRGVKAKEIDQAVYDDMVKRGSERMVDVIRHAIHEFPQWTTWYKTRLEMALNIFADIDPEAATPESQFHLKLLLALTSNGEKVDSNTVMTWDAYSTWLEMKRQGLEPKLANRGVTGARDIKDSLEKADSMIKERGWEFVQQFLDRSGPRSELIKNLPIEFPKTFPATFTEAEGTYDASKAANGELVTETIPYASMFGPKLGSFYNNLNGKFDTTTMDRWFMRTFGRTMGTQLKDAGPAAVRSRQRFLDAWGKLNKQDVDAILAEVKMDGSESAEELASAISKRMGVNKEFRLGWSRKNSARDEFRKASNAYAQVADGVDLLEAPENGPHRRFIRNVMSAAIAEMKNKYGWESSPAEVQALLWYYEKELHNEWESGETENPDYATGANKVFRIVDADKNAAQPGFVPSDAKSFAESGLESRRDAERPEYIAKVKASEAEKVLEKQRREAGRVEREAKVKSDIAAGKVELRDLAKLHSQAVAVNDVKGAIDLVKKAAAVAGKTRVVVVDELQTSDIDRMINGMTVLRYAQLDADGQIIPLNKRFAPDVANRQALNAVKKAIKSGDVRGMSLAKTGIVTAEEESAYSGAISVGEFKLAERLAQTILARVGITTPAVDAMYDKDGNPVSVNRLAIRAQEVSEATKKAAKVIYRASGGQSGAFSLTFEQEQKDREFERAVNTIALDDDGNYINTDDEQEILKANYTINDLMEEAARKAGYDTSQEWYQGSWTRWNVYDMSVPATTTGGAMVRKDLPGRTVIYTSSEIDVAALYGGNIKSMYMRFGSDEERNKYTIDAENKMWGTVYKKTVQMIKDGAPYVIVNNVLDTPEGEPIFSNVLVVADPSRLKTHFYNQRDDNGKLIPLSQRFDTQNPDVRYSLLPAAPWFKNGISKTDPLDFTGVDDPSTGWFVKQFADYMQPIRAVAKSIEKVAMESGGKLAQWSESMDVSARLDMYRNLTAEYMNQGKEFIDSMSAAMAEGNIPVSRQAGDEAGNSNVSVDEYLIARHAQRRNSVMLQDILNKDKQYSSAVASGNLAAAAKRKSDMIAANKSRMAAQKTGGMPVEADITMLSGMSDADAAAILAKAKSPAYQKVSDAMRLIQKRKLQVAVMSGLLSKEQADSWRRKYGEDYVPLKTTILDPNEQFLGGSGFVVRGPESKKAKGRSTMADDIAGHAVVDYSAMVSRGMKNMVGQAFYSMAAANPNDAWTLYDSREEVPVESLARIFVTKFNGEEKLMTINSAEMVRAMKNMDMADMGRGLAVASAASRAFTKLQTAWSPAFIAPNFVRDLGLALTITSVDETVASAVRVAKNIPSAVATIFAEQFGRAPGKLDRYYREMKQQGALTGYSNYYSVSDAAAALQLEAKKLRDGESMPVSYLKGLAGFMEKLNAVAERSTRLAVYAEARERGMSQLKAAEVAVNITVNFSRRGNATPVMNTLYPFFNANIQGTSNLARRMFWSESATPRQKRRMTAAIAGATAMGYMFSAIARGMGGDDEEGEEAYKNVPEYDLTRNLVLMKPDGSGDRYLLPLPWGVNLAYFAGVQSERMVKGDESAAESTGRVLKSAFESLSPINGATWTQTISPTLVDPIVQIAENQNFAGAKIMPDRNPFDKTPLPDSQLKFKSVNPAAAYVAEAINEITGGSARKPGLIDVSPESIEHITKFMGGGAGSFGYGVLSGFTKAAVSEEEMGIEEIPAVGAVAGRFLTEEDPARKTKTEFFENMKAYAVYREDLEDKETRGEARKSKLRTLDAYTTQVDSKLRDLRKRQLAAKSDAAAKRIERQSLDIMRKYNQRYNRLVQLDAQ